MKRYLIPVLVLLLGISACHEESSDDDASVAVTSTPSQTTPPDVSPTPTATPTPPPTPTPGTLDHDHDGSPSTVDCDDNNPQVYPEAPELCDGLDNDCDLATDENDGVAPIDAPSWYVDNDGDEYGDPETEEQECTQPDGYISRGFDCDDTDPAINPGELEVCDTDNIDEDCSGLADDEDPGTDLSTMGYYYPDVDGDSFGDQNNAGSLLCDAPEGQISENTDCDDLSGTVYPGAPEACNGIDDNCSGAIDEDITVQTWHPDVDADGFGDSHQSVDSCAQPPGSVTDGTDCDDSQGTVYPGAVEACDGLDNNCDGSIDEGVQSTFYADADHDGYGDPGSPVQACSAPLGAVADNTDCNDADGAVNPGAVEQCNSRDDNCNGLVDDNVASQTWYQDADGDTYGNPAKSQVNCAQPSGYVLDKTDCNDADASIHPDVLEACNGIDDNCDGAIDEGAQSTWYQDADKDGYGNPAQTTLSCAQPTGYVSDNTDCNDASASIHPNATETCNGVDDNCDGKSDEGVQTTWYQDADGDGYGNPAKSTLACTQPTGYVADKTDCNDASATIHPNATETCNDRDDNCNGKIDDGVPTTVYHRDADLDGYGVAAATYASCYPPAKGYTADKTDCDDTDATIHPNATESCNGKDDNCNGVIDDGATGLWYADADKDGYGNPTSTALACAQPAGYVSDNTDCNDADASIHPGAAESCNGTDDDCDGKADEDVQTTWYQDADKDGYGNVNVTTQACALPAGYSADKTDCNDADATVHPNATEACNGKDENCNGQIDEGVATSTWYADADKDNYGNPNSTTQACSMPSGYLADKTDCNDADASIHPGATETCNSKDDNCDGQIDNGTGSTWYLDADKDTYGSSSGTKQACTQPSGYVSNQSDCNDSDGTISPKAAEICDGLDNDCNSKTDDADADADTFSPCSDGPGFDCNDLDPKINPDATEACNQLDDNCDGEADEDFDGDGDGFSTCMGDCKDSDASAYPKVVDSGWVEYLCDPVLPNTAGQDLQNTDQAAVVKDSSLYRAYYRYGDSTSGPTKIAYATSSDGLTWSKKGVVLSPGISGSFDESRLNYPTAIVRTDASSPYQMWYHGVNAGGILQIGRALSSDGASWVKYDKNAATLPIDAVMIPSTGANDFDNRSVQAPSVLYLSSKALYYMWYGGTNTTTGLIQIGLATSPDGITWTRVDGDGLTPAIDPVFKLGATGTWDAGRVNFPRVSYNGSYFEMWYSGAAAGATNIFQIGYATSPDGINWTRFPGNPVVTTGGQAWKTALVFSPMTIDAPDISGLIGYRMWFGGGATTGGPFQTGLSTNLAPDVSFLSPYNKASFTTADAIPFEIFVEDPYFVDSTTVRIDSDLDGLVYVGSPDADGYVSAKRKLSTLGTHTITVTAQDKGGLSTIDVITLSVSQ